jgi:hypothetical protein
MPSSSDRDRGLRRVTHVTRWAAAVAVVLAGLFSAAAAKALPGKNKPTSQLTQTPAPSQPSAPVDGTGTGTNQSNGGLAPPVQPPQATNGGGSVVSGAS